jgi:hypothetical protein
MKLRDVNIQTVMIQKKERNIMQKRKEKCQKSS